MHSRLPVVLGVVLVTGVLTVVGFQHLLNRGASLPAGGGEFACGALLVGLVTLWLGWQVQRLKTRKATWITPVGASRVAALALALVHVGALLGGFFLGQVVFLVLNLPNEALFGMLEAKIAASLGAIFMVASGLVVEKICTINPTHKTSKPSSGTAPAPA